MPALPRAAAPVIASLLVSVAALAAPPCPPPPAPPTGVPSLDAAVERVRRVEGVRSLLVEWRGELLVEEELVPGAGGLHNVKSASKSLVSALVGAAIAGGHLPGVDATLGELLPAEVEGAPGKAAITLRHLLTMTAGLESTSRGNYSSWVGSSDWVADALRRPLVAAPGEEFIYSTGNSHLLSAILTRATGSDTLDYARRVLLEPLGIEVGGWDRAPEGIHFGGNNVSLTSRGLLALGRLYLRRGCHEGRRLLPAEWVEESTRAHSTGWPQRYGRYGYLWWIRPPEDGIAYMAVGYGGQFVLVAPPADAVVVVTSNLEGKSAEWDRRLLALVEEEIVAPLVLRAGG